MLQSGGPDGKPTDRRTIAYFSMEIGLESGMPTYSGGLGILAGDTIRAAADLQVPMVAVTLLHRKGYFFQRIDADGKQLEEPVEWSLDDFLEALPVRTTITLEKRTVTLTAWRREVAGVSGYRVPVYFLDARLDENEAWDRTLTDVLYGGDLRYRLCQEAVLGIGGVRLLSALGYGQIERYHMNEGHAGFLVLELLDRAAAAAGRDTITRDDVEAVRRQCIFTTHTPVPSGHDQFPMDLVVRVLGAREHFVDMQDVFCLDLMSRVFRTPDTDRLKRLRGATLNMTYLALNLSHYVNGVAKRHGEVSRQLFAGYAIEAITNGVHAATWVAAPLAALLDRSIPGWRQDSFSLRSALSLPAQELWQAHLEVKQRLVAYLNREHNAGMDKDVFTVGFARRCTPYKRNDLLVSDVARLKAISQKAGPIQIVYSGKAHPQDAAGKALIEAIVRAGRQLRPEVRLTYVPNYDLEVGRLMVGGVDLWVNTPEPPQEASGTSGMKAAVNGIPSLSVLDGWWVEGHIEGVTGWAIRPETGGDGDRQNDRDYLYDKLENVILPLFYRNRDGYVNVMRHCIALNGSFFNTHRMVQQYVLNAYFP